MQEAGDHVDATAPQNRERRVAALPTRAVEGSGSNSLPKQRVAQRPDPKGNATLDVVLADVVTVTRELAVKLVADPIHRPFDPAP
jgi:hypothetical protein